MVNDASSARWALCIFYFFRTHETNSLTCLWEEGSLYQRAVNLLVVVKETEAGPHAEGVSTASVYTTTHGVDEVVCELGGEGRGGEGRGGEGRGGIDS